MRGRRPGGRRLDTGGLWLHGGLGELWPACGHSPPAGRGPRVERGAVPDRRQSSCARTESMWISLAVLIASSIVRVFSLWLSWTWAQRHCRALFSTLKKSIPAARISGSPPPENDNSKLLPRPFHPAMKSHSVR